MKRSVLLGLFLSCVVGCSERPDPPPATLEELEKVTAAKSAHEIATYIFDNYGCKNCHTVASAGKFGYTALGEQLKNKSEGCISMLTSVRRIVTLPETSRTPENNEKLAHFKDYGCTACHRISFGSVDLTEVGAKLQTMHLACTDVQKALN
jgi:cytochrome c551/c552